MSFSSTNSMFRLTLNYSHVFFWSREKNIWEIHVTLVNMAVSASFFVIALMLCFKIWCLTDKGRQSSFGDFFLYFAVYSILFRNINIWNVDKRKQDQKNICIVYYSIFSKILCVKKKNRNKLNFLKKDELTIGDLHVGRPYLLMIVIAHW